MSGGGGDPISSAGRTITNSVSNPRSLFDTMGTGGLNIGAGMISGTLGEAGNILTGGAKDAAAAQERIALAQLEEQRRTRELATAAAEPTPQEMQQLQRSISLNEQDVARKERLIASADPALIEAGKQALSLLQGQEAKILDPIKRQRDKERVKLQEQLRAQLGSGFENTSAGIQALAAFDEGTSNVLANAQQQSLGQLLGVAQNTAGNFGLQTNIANTGTLAQLFGNQSNRRVAAINATPITAVGAEFVGDLAAGRSQQQMVNSLLNLGVTAGTAYATGGKSLAGTGNQNIFPTG